MLFSLTARYKVLSYSWTREQRAVSLGRKHCDLLAVINVELFPTQGVMKDVNWTHLRRNEVMINPRYDELEYEQYQCEAGPSYNMNVEVPDNTDIGTSSVITPNDIDAHQLIVSRTTRDRRPPLRFRLSTLLIIYIDW